jgi:hypothetical protein
MSARTVRKRTGHALALLLLVLAATATVSGLLNADSIGKFVVFLGFLALFVAGLIEMVRVLRRG